MIRPLALVAALAAGFLLFLAGSVTPPPLAADAPVTAFSAARAMADVRVIGREPHALPSPAQRRVRDYLIGRMTALGLSPQLQAVESFTTSGPRLAGGGVVNLIGVLPGRDPVAPAVALMAHYDSVPGSPGAADDSAGVAAALEIVRAIRAQGRPARDVMVILTDGEEVGLIGARAFFDRSPLAGHVGYVLNMEARGGGGRAAMFETARDNGEDIALYRRTAAAPVSNALTVFVYRHMPNSTDFTEALAHGKRGLNYAFIGRQFDYHSPNSTPEALDQGALQHMGAQVLPTAAALAFGPLPGKAPDVVYANLIGDLTAAYPAAMGWPILAAAFGLIVLGAWRARARGDLAAADMGRGLAASLYVLGLAGAGLGLARRATGVSPGFTEFRPILAQFPLFEATMLAAGLAALLFAAAATGRGGRRWALALPPLLAGLVASAAGPFDPVSLGLGVIGAVAGLAAFARPSGLPGSWTGLMLAALAAGVAVQAAAPTASAVVVWPLLTAALASALSAAGADRRGLVVWALAGLAALACAWLGALFHQLLQGLDLPALAALPVWLAALVLWPLMTSLSDEAGRFAAPAALAVVALGLALFIGLRDPWTARHPRAVEPVYIVDPAAGRAWRASLLSPDPWTRDLLRAEGGAVAPLSLPSLRETIAAAPAAVHPGLDAPRITAATAVDGTVTLTATPHPDTAWITLELRTAAPVPSVTVNGAATDLRPVAGRWTRIRWTGETPVTVRFRPASPATVEVFADERFDRWLAATPLPPRPARLQMWDIAGSTLVIGRWIVTPPAPNGPPRIAP